MTIRLIGSMGF